MPATQLIFFATVDGCVPFLDWFGDLPIKAQDKCRVRLERLSQLGHELRRPEADYLREGIYELRVGLQGINYRMLYFLHGPSNRTPNNILLTTTYEAKAFPNKKRPRDSS